MNKNSSAPVRTLAFRKKMTAQQMKRGTKRQGETKHKGETKRRGEMGEAAFLAKASSLGFGVAKPWGDSDRYDFIVDVGARLLKVQVKSAYSEKSHRIGGYQIPSYSGLDRRPYRADEIDLLVVYIATENAWYILPPSV